jgi:hypothetical protein
LKRTRNDSHRLYDTYFTSVSARDALRGGGDGVTCGTRSRAAGDTGARRPVVINFINMVWVGGLSFFWRNSVARVVAYRWLRCQQ